MSIISAPPWFAGGDGGSIDNSPLIFDPGGVTVPLFIATVPGLINWILSHMVIVVDFTVTVFNRGQFTVTVFDTELHLLKNSFKFKFEENVFQKHVWNKLIWLKSRMQNFLLESRLQKAHLRSNFGSFFDVLVMCKITFGELCYVPVFTCVSMFWRITEACYRKLVLEKHVLEKPLLDQKRVLRKLVWEKLFWFRSAFVFLCSSSMFLLQLRFPAKATSDCALGLHYSVGLNLGLLCYSTF